MPFIDKDPIEDLLPQTGWLGQYMEFTKNLQACARFRFFSAVCILGAAVNNRCWIQRGDRDLLPKLFPNLWIILLGPPGIGNKTQTINMACDCLIQACPLVRIMSDKLTPESLVKALSEPIIEIKDEEKIKLNDAVGLIKAPEASVLFGKQQYNVGMVSLITDLYDYRKKWTSETIMRGKNVLYNNCLSIIAGSTPDWLQSMLPNDAFTGGFMSRFVLVEIPNKYMKRVGWPRSPDLGGWEKLIDSLSNINRLPFGEMKWTDEAKDRYIYSYENIMPSGDKQQDAYKARHIEQVLKVSMALAVSNLDMELKAEYYEIAEKILDRIMEETSKRIDFFTTSPRMGLTQSIQELLRSFGKMTEGELMKRVYKNLDHGESQFFEAIRVMKIAGIIEFVPGTEKNKSPKYRLVRRI